MSTATDLQNDAFTQGSGLTNVVPALDYVHGKMVFSQFTTMDHIIILKNS